MKRQYPKTPAEENPFRTTIQRLSSPEKKRDIVLNWLKIPQPKRVPRNPKDLAKQLGIDVQTITEWTTEVKVEEQKVDNYNSKDYFLSRKREIDEGMFKAIK
ncbi:hypothetical protein LCGC14_2106060, partial [marine sediment metagenome]